MDVTVRVPTGECYQAGHLVIDLDRQRVVRDGIEVAMPRLSFELLVALARAYPRMVAIDELMDTVWSPAVVNPETVSQRVKLLRQTLGDAPGKPRLIVGVRGRGYRMEGPVVRLAAESRQFELRSSQSDAVGALEGATQPRPLSDLPPTNSGTRDLPRPATWTRWIVGAGAAVVLLGGGYAAVRHFFTTVTVPARINASSVSVNEPSIAVLPFLDLSEKKDQGYFSDGLTEELSSQLGQMPGLRVVAQASAFAFRGKNEDPRFIAEKLGVNHLLDGSVRRADDQLRVDAELINAADGTRLWSHTYNRKLEDVFGVQEDIAKDVASALSITLGVGKTAFDPGTSNFQAYDKYLRGRALWTEEGGAQVAVEAAGLYRDAVALDPKFVRAWYELGTVYQFLPSLTGVYTEEMERRTQDAYAHVETLAPNSWQAQEVRGIKLLATRKYAEAEFALHAAMESAPASEGTADGPYIGLLGTVGRIKEFTDFAERERLADPLSLAASGFLLTGLDFTGRRAEAQAEYERSLGLSGDHALWEGTALTLQWSNKGADPVAIEARFRAYLNAAKVEVRGLQSLPDKLADKAAAALLLHEAFKRGENQNPKAMQMIAIYADHFGDKDLALAALALYAKYSTDQFLWFPWETGLRTDPRFKQIVRDQEIDKYWRQSGKWSEFCHPVGSGDFECQ